jgi:CubicO group peptidase (beta-lactamase class C family)
MLLGTPADDDVEPLSATHLFDLASLTKIFTTVATLRLVDEGALDLDAPVAGVLAVGTGDGASRITMRHLLTHTSGLRADGREWWQAGLVGDELRAAVLGSALVGEPGSVHRYSDIGFVAAGEIAERVSGRPLAALVSEVARLLGALTLTWSPEVEGTVATERTPQRGLVRGEVHDEMAQALGRPAGHAGLFGTVDDVAALARMIRDDGRGEIGRVLSPESVALMTTPTVRADGWDQAVGLRVRDTSWMGDADAVGHTGFTGTAFAVNTRTGGYGVLLTNRVHPTRDDADVSAVRREFFAPLG